MTTSIPLYTGLARAAAYRGWVWSKLARRSTGDEAEAFRQSAANAFHTARILMGDETLIRRAVR